MDRPKLYRPVAAAIGFHARRRPAHPAVIRDGAAVGYAAFARDLAAMTHRLASFGLAAGSLAAVGHDDLYVQLLLVFGLESLGVVSGSFHPDEGVECRALLEAADLVLAVRKLALPGHGRLVRITASWVDEALAAPESPPPARLAAAGDGAVLLRSSGTTGAPKSMLLTQSMLAFRLRAQREPKYGLGLNGKARFLATMHFSVGSMYMAAANCFRLGATFMFHGAGGAAPRLQSDRPTHMTMLPFQLRILLERLPEVGAAPLLPGLTVQLIGAKLPAELRQQALQRLAGRLRDTYGTNEMGGIGTVDEAGTLALAPAVEAEIVDHRGGAVAAGAIGLIRVRSGGMVGGYLDDAPTTAAMFRDGWFHPGDLAAAIAPGRFRLMGRRGDVLNLGGIKVPCAELEAKILGRASVADVAVLQRNDHSATPPVVVCVVAGPALDVPALLRVLKPLIAFPFALRVVQAIPRTAEGKIKRDELRDTLRRELAAAEA